MARAYHGSEACIINSGCIRNDDCLDQGNLTYFTLSNIINNALLVLKVSGQTLFDILELSLENFPDAQSGNFLLISGIRYKFNGKAKPKVREITIEGKPIEMKKDYTVTMP